MSASVRSCSRNEASASPTRPYIVASDRAPSCIAISVCRVLYMLNIRSFSFESRNANRSRIEPADSTAYRSSGTVATRLDAAVDRIGSESIACPTLAHMPMGTRPDEQAALWVSTSELPKAAAAEGADSAPSTFCKERHLSKRAAYRGCRIRTKQTALIWAGGRPRLLHDNIYILSCQGTAITVPRSARQRCASSSRGGARWAFRRRHGSADSLPVPGRRTRCT